MELGAVEPGNQANQLLNQPLIPPVQPPPCIESFLALTTLALIGAGLGLLLTKPLQRNAAIGLFAGAGAAAALSTSLAYYRYFCPGVQQRSTPQRQPPPVQDNPLQPHPPVIKPEGVPPVPVPPSSGCVEKVKCFGNTTPDTDNHALSARGSNFSSEANPPKDDALKLSNTAPSPLPVAEPPKITQVEPEVSPFAAIPIKNRTWNQLIASVKGSSALGQLLSDFEPGRIPENARPFHLWGELRQAISKTLSEEETREIFLRVFDSLSPSMKRIFIEELVNMHTPEGLAEAAKIIPILQLWEKNRESSRYHLLRCAFAFCDKNRFLTAGQAGISCLFQQLPNHGDSVGVLDQTLIAFTREFLDRPKCKEAAKNGLASAPDRLPILVETLDWRI